MSNILDQLLGPPTPTGPTSPYFNNIMPRHLAVTQSPQAMTWPRAAPSLLPRHLAIPNMGGSVPIAGTPVNFPTYTPSSNPVAASSRFTPRIAPRVAPLAASARSSFSSSPLAKLGRVARGGSRLGRIAPAAIGGLLASPVGNFVGGQGQDTRGFDRRDVGQGVAGAMTGASLGSFGGWPGAIAGGIIGGVGNALNVFDVFGGTDKAADAAGANPENIGGALNDAMADLGITGKARDAIKQTTMAQLELATTDAERQQILSNAQAVMQQHAIAQEQSTQQLAHSLALQAQAAQIFEPYAEANQRNADMARVLFENASQGLPESQRYLAAQFALGAQQQSDALTQQMMTTAVAQPRLDALVAQQQQIEGVAAQLVQQAMAGAMAGGGGGVDVASLLAQAGG